MDEELRAYLEAMEGRLMSKIDALTGQMNNQHERLINDIGSLRMDFTNTKDFLLRDAAVRSRQRLDLEARVGGLERKPDAG